MGARRACGRQVSQDFLDHPPLQDCRDHLDLATAAVRAEFCAAAERIKPPR
jgi:hypothetical protein